MEEVHATTTWEEVGHKAVQAAKAAVSSESAVGKQGDGDGLLNTVTQAASALGATIPEANRVR